MSFGSTHTIQQYCSKQGGGRYRISTFEWAGKCVLIDNILIYLDFFVLVGYFCCTTSASQSSKQSVLRTCWHLLVSCHRRSLIICTDATKHPLCHQWLPIYMSSAAESALYLAWSLSVRRGARRKLFRSCGHKSVSSSQQVDYIWQIPTSGPAGWPRNYCSLCRLYSQLPEKKQCHSTLLLLSH